ncbi:uncharacterized protein PODANS_5_380 [Podospora anserina S mat+]|uniref:Podospora anserina S mat+ genomic DNA chromosome 5, supercontig 1 n=1 Tax=Podospora anserina (strain S / ATCC MYA-4624 / DSM 980 / FGSC 10383) TaxID=515849 RepID=B2AF69_PODAN|nr:uncharacterized protein PODANS_5_380 [Podospora anserina S mat+]CAP62086.1 unnamed protein product [Podospora anserina S mat+]
MHLNQAPPALTGPKYLLSAEIGVKEIISKTPGSGSDAGSVTTAYDDIPTSIMTADALAAAISDSKRASNNPSVPVAICGMAMRLPGGITSSEQFWDLLVNKRDARSRIPTSRYDVDSFLSSTGKSGTVNTTHGYFLDRDLTQFDASLLSMTRNEVEKLDPQQLLLLEITRECLENAGEADWRGKRIGCYVGTFGQDWFEMQSRDTQEAGPYRITGTEDFLLANRISYEYDFKGPSFIVKTACSSSLICLDLATKAIQNEDISSAIVGGSNLIMNMNMTHALAEQGVLSPNGSCRTFDADADGYARGEAVNMIYLKRLDEAIRDGNPIRAIIKGTATNFDGKTQGIAQPSSKSHEALIRDCYNKAGISDFTRTAMVEAHGTGTKTGDPIETTAIANVFYEKGVYIGSVKPNLGHAEGASGLTGVIKSVLALEHKVIPPNIKFDKPNPKSKIYAMQFSDIYLTGIVAVPFQKGLRVPVEPTPWPRDRHERISVSSFGIGGANAHLAYTLGERREHLDFRSYAVAVESAPTVFAAPQKAASTPSGVVFAFNGQGSQWASMGSTLISSFPSASDDLDIMDKVLSGLPCPPAWTLRDEILRPKETSNVNKAEFSQPLCTAVQIIIVNLLRKFGVVPAGVVGHSSGEIAAAYAASALDMQEAIVAAYLRGFVMGQQTGQKGAMAAVGLGKDGVDLFLVPGVVVACENSPTSVTLSGDADKIDQVIAEIKEEAPDVFVRKLVVEMAYHSHHMKSVGEIYETMLRPFVSSKSPSVPFFSTVTNKILDQGGSLDASYWRSNLESPVLFNTAVQTVLARFPESIIAEIGPHSALAGPLRQIMQTFQPNKVEYLPTLVRGQDGTINMLTFAGELFTRGFKLAFQDINPRGKVLTNLPNHPWHYEGHYWYESRLSHMRRFPKFPRHDLLGSHIAECGDAEPAWRNILRLADVPWIRDHMVGPDIVFPAAGYIAMAGEAVRQVTGCTDYTLRELSIGHAMICRDSGHNETVLTLRPHRLTTSLNSAWYEFTISSCNGGAWTKHCSGQVRGGRHLDGVEVPATSDLPRKIAAGPWYQTWRNVGLNYGPRFQGIERLSAHPAKNKAVAHIVNRIDENDSVYQLHPTTIDCCLQLFMAAACRGQTRAMHKRSIVPTFLGDVYIGTLGANNEMTVEAGADYTVRGGVDGTCMGVGRNNEDIVLVIRDIKLSPVGEEEPASEVDPHAGAHLVWKPHVAFQDLRDLVDVRTLVERETFPLLQKLTLCCSIEACKRLEGVIHTVTHEHLRKFHAWLHAQVEQAKTRGYALVDNVDELLQLSSTERVTLISQTAREIQNTEASIIGTAVHRIFDAIEEIFRGDIEALEVLREGDVLTDLYNFIDNKNYSQFLRLLSHSKPNLKILEVGAGTGATTEVVLGSLDSFSSYTFTDISAGFFPAAKERFDKVKAMEFMPLDISIDPASQGFKLGSYDLVIATNVLHATPSLHETLVNVRKLLKPDGQMLLQELSPTTKWFNYTMGPLSGWWLGEADGRPDEPYVGYQRWIDEMSKAGFEHAHPVMLNEEDAFYELNITWVASGAPPPPVDRRGISVLSAQPESPVANAVVKALQNRNFEVEIIGLHDTPKSDIISILDLETNKPFLDGLSPTAFSQLQAFTTNLGSSSGFGMLWLTKSSQVNCTEPQYSRILGLARTIRNELLVDFATLELENLDFLASDEQMNTICKVLCQFQQQIASGGDQGDDDSGPDYEYALVRNTVYVPRFHRFSVEDSLALEADSASAGVAKKLKVTKRGSLKGLEWVNVPNSEFGASTLVGDEVIVDTRAAGMNFKDILTAMGVIDGQKVEGTGLGLECAGVVSAVGPGAASNGPKVGDRVAVGAFNSYATRVKARIVAKIPDEMSFEEAATIPSVYCTVIHGLLDLARLKAGQSVLIHSACGGIGIAAIHVARMVGAEIYATVGSEEKVQYLVDTFDIPRQRIFHSRDSSFVAGVYRETKGQGVDVVLNSLSGDLLHASWKCVAEFGSMVEIGKRDFIGHGKLAMDMFQENRSFFGVDLAPMYVKRPEMAKSLLERAMAFYKAGKIHPILPMTCYDWSQLEDGLRFMQTGQHTGKLVVRMPGDPLLLPATATVRSGFSLRADASYLLVGGLGGLGRQVAIWMAESGARHLVFLSRSGQDAPEASQLTKELAAMGCAVKVIKGSVTSLQDVRRVASEARPPVAGVVQLAMVLRDAAFPQMTHNDWEAVMGPKVEGTWNLHKAFSDESLDFFVLFGSSSGVWGNRGQANYAAANTFLDSFVQYRHHLGLCASVMDVGIVGDVGYVSQNKAIKELFQSKGAHILGEQKVLDALELAIKTSGPPAPKRSATAESFVNKSQLAIGLRVDESRASAQNRAVSLWGRDPRFGVLRSHEKQKAGTAGSMPSAMLEKQDGCTDLDELFAAASDNAQIFAEPSASAIISRHIGTTLLTFMMKPVESLDVTASPVSLGIDSLMAIELRNWCRQRLGTEVTVLEIMGAPSIESLGMSVVERLLAERA